MGDKIKSIRKRSYRRFFFLLLKIRLFFFENCCVLSQWAVFWTLFSSAWRRKVTRMIKSPTLKDGEKMWVKKSCSQGGTNLGLSGATSSTSPYSTRRRDKRHIQLSTPCSCSPEKWKYLTKTNHNNYWLTGLDVTWRVWQWCRTACRSRATRLANASLKTTWTPCKQLRPLAGPSSVGRGLRQYHSLRSVCALITHYVRTHTDSVSLTHNSPKN